MLDDGEIILEYDWTRVVFSHKRFPYLVIHAPHAILENRCAISVLKAPFTAFWQKAPSSEGLRESTMPCFS